MTRKGKLLLAGLAAGVVGLAAAGAMAQRGHWDGHKGRHFGGGGYGAGVLGLGFGAPNARMCKGKSAEMTDVMLVRLEHRVELTDAQKGAFEEFKVATRAAADKIREGCPKKPEPTADGNQAATPKLTPLDRLAQTQTGLEASLDALKTYRPAAEKFFAQLSDDQKAKLTEKRGGKRHWKKDRDENRGGRDGGPEKHDDKPEDKG